MTTAPMGSGPGRSGPVALLSECGSLRGSS